MNVSLFEQKLSSEASSCRFSDKRADAVHFVYGAFLGVLWCLTRLFVKTPSVVNA